MTMTNIEQRLIDIIKDYSKIDSAIVPEMDLIFDLGFDSLSFTELIVACEDEFKIEIEIDNLSMEASRTIKGLATAIESLLNSN